MASFADRIDLSTFFFSVEQGAPMALLLSHRNCAISRESSTASPTLSYVPYSDNECAELEHIRITLRHVCPAPTSAATDMQAVSGVLTAVGCAQVANQRCIRLPRPARCPLFLSLHLLVTSCLVESEDTISTHVSATFNAQMRYVVGSVQNDWLASGFELPGVVTLPLIPRRDHANHVVFRARWVEAGLEQPPPLKTVAICGRTMRGDQQSNGIEGKVPDLMTRWLPPFRVSQLGAPGLEVSCPYIIF